MPKTFTIKAGKTALAHIRKNGLLPNDISVIPAAAGGPKWISLYAFDKYLLSNWFADRQKPLHLVGASAGAWRMLCYTLPDSLAALNRFLKYYVEQSYGDWPTTAELRHKMEEIISNTLGAEGKESLLVEQVKRLYVISTETNFRKKANSKYRKHFARIASKNAISRKWMQSEVNRVVFTNSVNHEVLVKDGFPTKYLPFTPENTLPALRSTGSIPLIMSPVEQIKNVSGLLWDGALVDYHMGLDYETEGLIFYPHFSDHIIEGWFDKFLRWRKFKGKVLDKMILVAPSKAFIVRLPDGKIPDRKDFEVHSGNNEQRIKNWYEVAKMGTEMTDEFDHYWKSGKLQDVIQPFGR